MLTQDSQSKDVELEKLELMYQNIQIKLNSDALEYLSGNLSHNARTDITVMGFEKPFVTCHIDVSVISPVCESNKSNSVGLSISSTEKKKESDYSMRIKEQLGGDFIPAIFSSGGGIGNSAKKSSI